MLSRVAPPPPRLLIVRNRLPRIPPKLFVFPTMKGKGVADAGASSPDRKKFESATSSHAEEEDVDLRSDARLSASRAPQTAASSGRSSLCSNSKLSSEDDFDCKHRRDFSCFIAREALDDVELWMVAMLRVETRWEDCPDNLHVDGSKFESVDREFKSLKKRCKRELPQKCVCIVAKNKDEDVNQNAILGTLDLWPLLTEHPSSEDFERSLFLVDIDKEDRPRFSYVANLCVSKNARRQGIAKNMLSLAIEVASSCGSKELFVHVRKSNIAAQKLYDQLGFQVVENDFPDLPVEDHQSLLCLKI